MFDRNGGLCLSTPSGYRVNMISSSKLSIVAWTSIDTEYLSQSVAFVAQNTVVLRLGSQSRTISDRHLSGHPEIRLVTSTTTNQKHRGVVLVLTLLLMLHSQPSARSLSAYARENQNS